MEEAATLVDLETVSAFDSLVLESPVPVLVDFYAEWCGPCQTLGSLLEELVEDAERPVRVVKIDVNEMPELATRFKVRGIPTLLLIHKGEVVDRKMSVPTLKELHKMVAELQETANE